ncbi:hypothetical protein [Nocardioides sp. B-3]|uniref:hypothetical protein n=1 Tax=Nocardioides sp. B-3 TaxID=2895565 RepID=UPI003FA5FA6D
MAPPRARERTWSRWRIGGVAVGRAAATIAHHDEIGEGAPEEAGGGLRRDQGAGPRHREESLDRRARVLGAGGGEGPGDRGRDVARALQVAGLVAVAEQGLRADHQLDRGRQWCVAPQPAEPADRGVGDELAAAALVTPGAGLLGRVAERGHDHGEIAGRQVRRQPAHPVAEDAAGDPPPGPGLLVAGVPAVFVAAKHLAPHDVAQVGVAEAVQLVADRRVHGPPLTGAEVSRLAGDDLGPTLVEVAALEGGQRLGQVAQEGAGRVELAATVVRRLATREADLLAETRIRVGSAPRGLEQPAGLGPGPAVLVELMGDARLRGTDGGLESLEGSELLDALARVDGHRARDQGFGGRPDRVGRSSVGER